MERTVRILLLTIEDTRRFGRILARSVMRASPGALLLYGELGAGKTALARALVEALPGGNAAEVSSPSFTICNIYCTAPQVRHFDLYRLGPGMPDEALEESFDDPAALTIVEWPERLAGRDMPDNGLICRLAPGPDEGARLAELSAIGPLGKRCLDVVRYVTLEKGA